MHLEDIAPGQVLEGIDPGGLAWVIAAHPLGADACAVLYRSACGLLGERLLRRQHERLVRVPARQRPWAFDADGQAFRRAAIECLQVGPDAGRNHPAAACRVLQRGAFLLDPSRHGLSPELLLLAVSSRPGPGEGPASRRFVCLAVHPPCEDVSMPDPPFDRVQSINAADRSILHEALAPLLANRRVRDRALAFLAHRLDAAAPHPVWTPPVIVGAAVVVSPDLIRWLHQPGDASQARRTPPRQADG